MMKPDMMNALTHRWGESMLRRLFSIVVFLGCSFVSLTHAPQSGSAQGFDPATVDWEKLAKIPMRDGFITLYNDNCAVCHGEDLQGAPLGTPLVGMALRHGDTVEEIADSIATGFEETGMPPWAETLRESQIWNLALYVAEQRQGTTILDKRKDIPLDIPQGVVETEQYNFRIETIATGLDPMPFSIAPMPDGRIFLSERMRGLSIIEKDGETSGLILGTPAVYDDSGMFLGQVQGLGWMLDVALHPDYEENGWIYIHHTDRCAQCNDLSERSGRPVSMNRLIRGRIKDGVWVDEEVIWSVGKELYTGTSDLAAGGRIAFDDKGYVYISTGMKDTLDFMGIQDLDKPHGKIMRLHDDGRIPDDNPFVDSPGAEAVWTYGHRSSQGLEFNPRTGDLWNSEMGPRGGDELNRLVRGGNYGWPVFTKGVNYDGRPVDVADQLGLTLREEDAIFPVLDMTPSPAISSFIFYQGDEFPKWQNNILIGTLRATDLMRFVIEDDQVVHKETLLENIVRFRDLELGPNGELFVLVEHASGGQILRLSPAD